MEHPRIGNHSHRVIVQLELQYRPLFDVFLHPEKNNGMDWRPVHTNRFHQWKCSCLINPSLRFGFLDMQSCFLLLFLWLNLQLPLFTFLFFRERWGLKLESPQLYIPLLPSYEFTTFIHHFQFVKMQYLFNGFPITVILVIIHEFFAHLVYCYDGAEYGISIKNLNLMTKSPNPQQDQVIYQVLFGMKWSSTSGLRCS